MLDFFQYQLAHASSPGQWFMIFTTMWLGTLTVLGLVVGGVYLIVQELSQRPWNVAAVFLGAGTFLGAVGVITRTLLSSRRSQRPAKDTPPAAE